ncbi:MAG: type IV pilus twitching motility protein PilT [Nitrospirota bacterium]
MNLVELFKLCKDRNASDLHLSTGAEPLIRVVGQLEKVSDEKLSKEDVHSAIYSLLNDEQKLRFEKDKELDFSIEVTDIARFRVNIYSQMRGESAAFRLISTQIRKIAELGLPVALETLALATKGLVLITGPTGCGKTTTLAAMIDLINEKKTNHIITIEDPIEYIYENKNCLIDQREVGTHTGSFCSALRNALREDPNVILIGEMRDLETISMALTAAETGHLVFATLHTNSASQTINRIVDVFPADQQAQVKTQLADAILGIVSQTLIPTMDEKSRLCAIEVLIGTHGIKNLIREGKLHQLPSLIQTGKKDGMQTMDQALETLVNEGKITRDEAAKRASSSELFKKSDYGYSYELGRRV